MISRISGNYDGQRTSLIESTINENQRLLSVNCTRSRKIFCRNTRSRRHDLFTEIELWRQTLDDIGFFTNDYHSPPVAPARTFISTLPHRRADVPTLPGSGPGRSICLFDVSTGFGRSQEDESG